MSELALPRLSRSRMRPRGLLNAVLAALLVLVVAALVAVLAGGAKVLPWTTPAGSQVAEYAQVRASVGKVMTAFLDVDYRQMNADVAAVRKLATGAFAQQYSSASVELAAAAEEARSVSKGTIRYVGVTSVSGRTATAMVAADVVVTNNSTKGNKATSTCPKAGAQCDTYRFAVTMTRTSTGWMMSNLVGVS